MTGSRMAGALILLVVPCALVLTVLSFLGHHERLSAEWMGRELDRANEAARVRPEAPPSGGGGDASPSLHDGGAESGILFAGMFLYIAFVSALLGIWLLMGDTGKLRAIVSRVAILLYVSMLGLFAYCCRAWTHDRDVDLVGPGVVALLLGFGVLNCFCVNKLRDDDK